MTASPRLSYLGLQVALAFYLINLSDLAIQTSLYPARDRVIGILLGLCVMWLVFDRLWAAPATVTMKSAYISGLRMLAQFTREPISENLRAAVVRSNALAETISASFDQVRSLADAVLFEFGPSRRRDLTLRQYIRRWQPHVRSLFLMRIASFRYRLRLPAFELPEAVQAAQQAYDERSALFLEVLADRLEGKLPPETELPATGLDALEQVTKSSHAEGAQQARLETFIDLYRHIDEVLISLAAPDPGSMHLAQLA